MTSQTRHGKQALTRGDEAAATEVIQGSEGKGASRRPLSLGDWPDPGKDVSEPTGRVELAPQGVPYDLEYEGYDAEGQPITVTVYRPSGR